MACIAEYSQSVAIKPAKQHILYTVIFAFGA